MRVLKSKDFWIGAIAGYALVVLFPQVNIRTKAIKGV
jgi:hypothetical protein